MGKKSLIVLSVLSIVLAVGITVYSAFCGISKGYYLAATLIIILSIVPFFAYFEGRKIKTTEVVVIALMIAIATVSRLAFSFVPQVKPMAAFVIVTGMAFGANAGFITGAVSIFVSNFFLGQGMFTPFQMIAMGLVGFVCGLIFHNKAYSKNKLIVAITGGVIVFALYGVIVDTCSVLMMSTDYSFASVISIYGSGVIMNIIHGATTAIVLYFINRPMNNKFERLRIKYGVFDL